MGQMVQTQVNTEASSISPGVYHAALSQVAMAESRLRLDTRNVGPHAVVGDLSVTGSSELGVAACAAIGLCTRCL